MSEPTPTWLTIGAEVAILADDWKRNPRKPARAKVLRIGKRDIVLDDGQRFRVRDLKRDDGGGSWSRRHFCLFAPDDPIVIEANASYRHEVLVHRAKVAAENFRYGREGATAVDVILACAPLTGRAEEIAALFTDDREGRA